MQWPLATFIRSGFSIVTLSATRFLDCIRAAVRGQCLWGSCVGAGMVCPSGLICVTCGFVLVLGLLSQV